METILIDCVQNSLRHLLYRNAIFMCERLCAQFPSEEHNRLNPDISLPWHAFRWICLMKLKQHCVLLASLVERFQTVQLAIIFLVSSIGAAEEGNAIFGESASRYVQKLYSGHGVVFQSMPSSTENKISVSARNLSPHAPSSRQVKNMHSNTLKDNSGSYHGIALSGGASGQPINGSFTNMTFYSTPSPMTAHVFLN